MGAWDYTTFGNDDACDWGQRLHSEDGLTLIGQTLDEIVKVGEKYLEAEKASVAIAAAEVIARLQGHLRVRDAYTETIDRWVSDHRLKVPLELARKAHVVLDRIVAPPSELLELWKEGKDYQSWLNTIVELKSKIEA
jgi:hypothetical protein